MSDPLRELEEARRRREDERIRESTPWLRDPPPLSWQRKHQTTPLVACLATLVGVAIVGLMFLAVKMGNDPVYRSEPAAKSGPPVGQRGLRVVENWRPTPEEVAQRTDFISRAQRSNIFGEIYVRNNIGRVVVKPAFFTGDFKQRQSLANVAMAWCLDRDPDCMLLVLMDYRTNKEIGRFDEAGLEFD